MANVLVLHSSILGANSSSNALITAYLQQHPGHHVTSRNLATHPLPILDGEILQSFGTGALNRHQDEVRALSDELIAELQAADVLIIGAPMYNFGIPVQLRAWFDLICRAGITFKYTETGITGLVTRPKVLVVSSRGGVHANSPTDQVCPYLKTILTFLGMTHIDMVLAEGLNMGDAPRQAGLAKAQAQLQQLTLLS